MSSEQTNIKDLELSLDRTEQIIKMNQVQIDDLQKQISQVSSSNKQDEETIKNLVAQLESLDLEVEKEENENVKIQRELEKVKKRLKKIKSKGIRSNFIYKSLLLRQKITRNRTTMDVDDDFVN